MEWEKYKVGRKESYACLEFSFVRHIFHMRDAIRIVEDGIIRSSLIWDESKLNNTRTCVSWISPNQWGGGSFYGNISFEFNWISIIQDKRLYWVESIKYPNHDAYRFLVTDKNYDSWDELIPYDASIRGGPLFFDGEKWYFNSNHACELMIDSDLSLHNCIEINFVNHHARHCAKFGQGCADSELNQYYAGPIFLSSIIGRQIKGPRNSIKNIFLMKNDGVIEIKGPVKFALNNLISIIEPKITGTQSIVRGENANIIFRSALVSFGDWKGDWKIDDALGLLNLLGPKEEFIKNYNEILSEFFGFQINLDGRPMI